MSREKELARARAVWNKLGEIAINHKDEIDEGFMCFDRGTDKLEIWEWIEETYNVSIMNDLMLFE